MMSTVILDDKRGIKLDSFSIGTIRSHAVKRAGECPQAGRNGFGGDNAQSEAFLLKFAPDEFLAQAAVNGMDASFAGKPCPSLLCNPFVPILLEKNPMP